MRITGGDWASRRVGGPPRSSPLRPTPDALREQAFAVLGPEVAGADFLDLFAGTGVNSLEALSRGAARAVLVERSPAAAALIRRNFAEFAVPPTRWLLEIREAARALSLLAGRNPFALGWCDPPFSSWAEGVEALGLARQLGVLRPGAKVVLEAPPKSEPPISGFSLLRRLRGAFLLRVEG